MGENDVIVLGGGIAGMTAAACFAQAGFRTVCVDPAPPVTTRDADGSDLRSTALLQPARALLERCGLWDRFAPHATPLEVMRIVDAGGDEATARVTRDFRADDISDRPFGWNLPNWLIRRELVAALSDLERVDFRPGTATRTLFTRTGEARVGLSDGSLLRTRLVVAADGRDSPMRRAAGIGVELVGTVGVGDRRRGVRGGAGPLGSGLLGRGLLGGGLLRGGLLGRGLRGGGLLRRCWGGDRLVRVG